MVCFDNLYIHSLNIYTKTKGKEDRDGGLFIFCFIDLCGNTI